MGMGPVPATAKALARAGLALAEMDVIELNEAFAAQALAVLRQWGLADDAPHVNANGGAIAIGHPLGASGARLAATAIAGLHSTGGRYALCTMCIGVGQGVAADTRTRVMYASRLEPQPAGDAVDLSSRSACSQSSSSDPGAPPRAQ